MPARILVLSPRYTSDSRVLRAAALEAGWSVERLGSPHAPERLYDREVALYGGLAFVEKVAAQLSLALIDAPHDWLLQLPIHYRRRTVELTTLEEARALSQPTFVKPADGRKGFEGIVYTSGEHLPSADIWPADTQVLIAEPIVWEVEFRCFVLERQVMTISPYWRAGEVTLTETGVWEASPAEYAQAQAFMEVLLADAEVLLPPAIIVDIGLIRDRGWAVIEANAVWAAGMYGCDPMHVLPVLARSCIKRDQLTEEDARWVLDSVLCLRS